MVVGCGMMGYGAFQASAGWMFFTGLLGVIIFVLACFIFSTIFWGVYHWVEKDNKPKKKGKKR